MSHRQTRRPNTNWRTIGPGSASPGSPWGSIDSKFILLLIFDVQRLLLSKFVLIMANATIFLGHRTCFRLGNQSTEMLYKAQSRMRNNSQRRTRNQHSTRRIQQPCLMMLTLASAHNKDRVAARSPCQPNWRPLRYCLLPRAPLLKSAILMAFITFMAFIANAIMTMQETKVGPSNCSNCQPWELL